MLSSVRCSKGRRNECPCPLTAFNSEPQCCDVNHQWLEMMQFVHKDSSLCHYTLVRLSVGSLIVFIVFSRWLCKRYRGSLFSGYPVFTYMSTWHHKIQRFWEKQPNFNPARLVAFEEGKAPIPLNQSEKFRTADWTKIPRQVHYCTAVRYSLTACMSSMCIRSVVVNNEPPVVFF